jgi:hypothetical protein
VSAYDEFMEFLAQRRSPEEVLAFKASPTAQHRADELTERNKASLLSDQEKIEFEEMLQINQFVSRLKAKAARAMK